MSRDSRSEAVYVSLLVIASAGSCDEAVDEGAPEADFNEVPAAYFEAGKDILVASDRSVRVDVQDRAGRVEKRDHFIDAFRDHQRVRIAGGLEYVRTLGRLPVVLQVVPPALQYITMHGRGVAVTIENPGLRDPQQMDPIALRGHEAQRPRPDLVAERNPEARVFRQHIGNDGLPTSVGGPWATVRNPAGVVFPQGAGHDVPPGVSQVLLAARRSQSHR